MLSRPTTEQILLDCCRELMTAVLPALTDETAQVSVIMVETVLRNAAVRVHILGHRKDRRFRVKRDQQPEKFLYGVFPAVTEARQPRRAEIENAGVGLTPLCQRRELQRVLHV